MNGAGNRFAVFDARSQPNFELTGEQVKFLAKPGGPLMGQKGADQIIVIRRPKVSGADVFMELWNQKGFQIDACGNGTRCAAWFVLRDTDKADVVIETGAGLLKCKSSSDRQIEVDMGPPRLEWDEVPLSKFMQTDYLDLNSALIDHPALSHAGAVSMGNPHCVFFVENFTDANPKDIGPVVELHPLFPEQTNVGFARIDSRKRIRLKVWERGVGMTLACGTGACAAVVSAARQSRTGRKVEVEADGGVLSIEWREVDNHVIMTGPIELESEDVYFSQN